MKVSVCYATAQSQTWLHLELEEGATVGQAIEKSGLLDKHPEIELSGQPVGIFGQMASLEAPLAEGDRVEIYRPITADPLTVPRRSETPDQGETPGPAEA